MKVLCPHCGVLNNVSLEKASQTTPLCGKCRQPLEPRAPGYPVKVSDQSFSQEVPINFPVLLDLWGPSCPPCQRLSPLLKELSKEYAGRLKVAKLNVSENPQTAARLQVRGVPTLILFRGKELARLVGFRGLPELRSFVEPHLGP